MPDLGVILYSESEGKVTGFLIASIEYLEYKGGNVYFIHHSVGLNDEIEIANNTWVRDVYLKDKNCKEIICITHKD